MGRLNAAEAIKNTMFVTNINGLPSNQIAITGVQTGTVLPTNFKIPATFHGKTVTSIGNGAFKGHKGPVFSVTIPSTVTSIGNEAIEAAAKKLQITDVRQIKTKCYFPFVKEVRKNTKVSLREMENILAINREYLRKAVNDKE